MLLSGSRSDIGQPVTGKDIVLRPRDPNAVSAELLVDRDVQLAREQAPALNQLLAPRAQLELESCVRQAQKAHARRGLLEHRGLLSADLEQQALDQSRVAAHRHRHRNAKADPVLDVAPVDDVLGDELRVGDDDGDVIIGEDGGAPGATTPLSPDRPGSVNSSPGRLLALTLSSDT